MILATLSLEGCGTVSPSPIGNNMPTYDSSTPSQYNPNNSGLIEYVADDKGQTAGAIITKNAREKYNNLIEAYAGQFYESEKTRININDGIKSYQDSYQNDLYLIDAEHLAYFMKLNRWKKEQRPNDSIWMKAKNSLIQ